MIKGNANLFAGLDRITDRNYVNVTLGDVRQVDTTHKNKQVQMEE